MSRVELEAISADRRPALDAMFQLYTHDFSEFWAGQDRGELPESGQFDPIQSSISIGLSRIALPGSSALAAIWPGLHC